MLVPRPSRSGSLAPSALTFNRKQSSTSWVSAAILRLHLLPGINSPGWRALSNSSRSSRYFIFMPVVSLIGSAMCAVPWSTSSGPGAPPSPSWSSGL